MPVQITKTTATTSSVFNFTGLTAGANYRYTINESASDAQLSYGPLSPTTTKDSLDLTTTLAAFEAGEYELRLYKDSDFNPTTKRPDAGARPLASLALRFLPATANPNNTAGTLVRLDRSAAAPTPDEVLWDEIRTATEARQFPHYQRYIDAKLCRTGQRVFGPKAFDDLVDLTRTFLEDAKVPIVDPEGRLAKYQVNGTIPYIAAAAARYPDAIGVDPCSDIDLTALSDPFPVELIWSYYLEEGALVQTLNHILAKFQNRRPGRGIDPLARFDLSPLRPLRSMLYAWAESEISRLTVRRRDAEYRYEYGYPLVGRAIPGDDTYVERRTKFPEAFNTLLHVCHTFFRQDDDTTVQADAFPILNALRETHLVLAEGAHNQFGDLPTEARIQMMVMQWLLAQPEMRDFLGGRPMVPYEETWMDRVDTMKSVQGWTDTSVTHFRDLAVYGEQLVLSIRYGDWNTVILTDSAKNWARTWRPQIQRFVHAYRAACGVDLADRPDATPPAVLLARRAAPQPRRA